MPITPFLKNQAFEPELIRAMGIALESGCERLGPSGAEDRATEMVASKLIRPGARRTKHKTYRAANIRRSVRGRSEMRHADGWRRKMF